MPVIDVRGSAKQGHNESLEIIFGAQSDERVIHETGDLFAISDGVDKFLVYTSDIPNLIKALEILQTNLEK